MLPRRVIVFFLAFVGSAIGQSRAPHSVVVKLRASKVLSDVRPKLDQLGVSKQLFPRQPQPSFTQSAADDIDRIYLVRLSGDLSADSVSSYLAADPAIEYAEPNYVYHVDATPASNDSLFDKLWWLKNVRAPEAWQETTGDTSVQIGFVDTGVLWDHPDLKNQFAINKLEDINHNGLFDAWSSHERRVDAHGDTVTGDLDGIDEDGNGFVDDVIGYDFVDQEVTNFGDWSNRDAIPQDENGHGTAIAGILAAQMGNRIGIAGVAPGSRLVALRAFDATGNGEDDDIAAAIIYAADNGVKVLNLSFGDIYPSLLQRDAIRYARRKGMVVFASSGNQGGDSPHYPSDFDEVVSVGATTDFPSVDNVWGLTTHGEAMDIVAPGDEILTTNVGGGYRPVSGTSASSPIAAASVALLLSKRPKLDADEVRSILASTAQDIGTPGYDHYSAHGRIDVKRALDFPGGANVTISSMHTLDVYPASDGILTIRGTAVSSLFTRYELSFAPTDNPERYYGSADTVWKSIVKSNDQVVDSVLGGWSTAGLHPGLYTVRLAIYTSDRRTIEDRRVIRISNSAPTIVSATVDPILIHDERGVLVQALTDIPTRMSVLDRTTGTAKQEDKIGLEHSLLLQREELGPATARAFHLSFTTTAGDTASEDLSMALPNDAVPQTGFGLKPYALPPGYALDTVLTTPLGDLVVENVFPDGVHFGPLKIFAFNGSRFSVIDSLEDSWIPRALGSTRGDGVPEVLLQRLDTTVVYRQNAGHTLLGDIVFQQALWGSTLADLNGDGKKEIVGYQDTTVVLHRTVNGQSVTYDSLIARYIAYAWTGSGYQVLGTMPNPSPRDSYNPFNRYSEPNAEHADFDGDGKEDLATMDDDADLVIFTRDVSSPTGFRPAYVLPNDGQSGGSLLTVADFDGDGKPDVAYAYHTYLAEDTLAEYPAAYWTMIVLRNRGNFTFDTIYSDRFAYARGLDPYRSSVRSMPSVTGRGVRDLGASLFPDFFLLEYDASQKRMKPIWQYPMSITARGALAFDLDRNGKREFGFVAGDSLRFFERGDPYADRAPSPSSLIVSPRDVDRVDLEWGGTSDADLYYILRAAPGDPNYEIIDSTTETSYSDRGVSDGDQWYYAVASHDATFANAFSLPSYAGYAFVHPTPRVQSIHAVDGALTLATTFPPRTEALTGAEFAIDDSTSAHSASIASDSTILVNIDLRAGDHTLRVTSTAVRDIFNSPFDTSQAIAFHEPEIVTSPHFYVVRWQFMTSNGVTTAHVTFNARPSDAALDPVHYTLTPYGSIERVYRDSVEANALYVELSHDVRFVALGKPFVLCVDNIEDTRSVPLDESEANCAGISFAEQDLSSAFVYPNPAKSSLGRVMFARLTPVADIQIYALNMRPIRHLHTAERQGGVEWDLRDDAGKLVGSGEYLFLATGTNDAGAQVESKIQKFVVVRDE